MRRIQLIYIVSQENYWK